ncbi:hypothetical protein [Bremerella cremea]|uniref:hypothetical protein n=1 Tax=Bremerella cremea TaxID=1031537 RepID=UPI0031EC3A46
MADVSSALKSDSEACRRIEPAITPVSDLKARILSEVNEANARVQALREVADQTYATQDRKCRHLSVVAGQVKQILQERISGLLTMDAFQDLIISDKQTSHVGLGPRGFGKTTTIVVPRSDRCLAKVVLEFHVDGDFDYDKAVLDFKLEIVPVFLKFKANDRLSIPADAFSAGDATAWIDDKILVFVRAYFEIYFSEYYQSETIVHDPVLNISFPKAFAMGNKQYNGKTYYMLTEGSQQRFEDQPGSYVSTR